MTSAPSEKSERSERSERDTEKGRRVDARRPISSRGSRRIRVLVADDDERSLDCLIALLDHQVFNIDPARCGLEALERCGLDTREGTATPTATPTAPPTATQQIHVEPSVLPQRVLPESSEESDAPRPYDFLVLDYNMPDVTGIEVLRRIHVRFGGPLPAIMVSGDYSRELQKSWNAVGGFALLPKPVEPDDFRNQVNQLVHRFFGGGLS